MNLVSTKWELCLLPCAGCCLKLQNVKVNLRSSEAVIVASYSCWKLMLLAGKLIGVCSLHWHRGRTWAHNLCLESYRPDGQTVHSQSGVAHGFSLIPVSGVGVVWWEIGGKRDRRTRHDTKRLLSLAEMRSHHNTPKHSILYNLSHLNLLIL